ncbi:MAG: O-antigen ligase family protein [Oscillospiraceae bacterium]|nr:O-antigen ligase family protein [Oscillospiraceae bacterium]
MDKKRNRFIKNSAVISFLLFLSNWIYKKINGSIAAAVFTGYEKCEKYYKKSFFYNIFQGYEPGPVKNTLQKAKKSIITACENSAVINGVKNSIDGLLAVKLYNLGALLISFGFYSAIMYLLKIFVLNKPETLAIDMIAAVSLTAAGILMTLSKQSLYHAVHGSAICSALFFGFFGFAEKRDKTFIELLERTNNTKGRNIICFFIGMVAGILTYFVSPVYICAGLAGTAALYAVLCYPEAGFLALLFAVPFLPSGNLILTGAAPCILVFCCYFLKLIRGKRTFDFEIFDLFVLMFCGLIFFGGFISVSRTGSIRPALVYLCFTLTYFTGVNMIRSKEMIMRCVAALTVSSFLVAGIGIYQNYFGIGDTRWQDETMFANISGRIGSTFGNPNVLATYLTLVIPFIIISLGIYAQLKTKAFYGAGLVVTGLCLVFTWSRGSWLAFVLSCLVLFIILDKRIIAVYAGAALLVPFLPVVLPENIIQRFISIGNITDSSTSYRVSIWQGTLRMLRNHFFEGIGIGIEPYKLVYPEYALSGIESAPHSHSLYLQICVEYGVIGLLVFVPLIFLFVQYCFTAMKKTGEKYLKLFTAAGFCAVMGFLLNGFTDLVWYNYRVYLIFWLVAAVTVGICRFALKNQSQQDKMY